MKLREVISIMLLSSNIAYSQVNLVPNPGFEEYSECPDNRFQLYRATPWVGANQYNASFCHYCAPEGNMARPPEISVHSRLYAEPRSGEGMTLLTTYAPSGNSRGQNYLQTPLNRSLEKDELIYVEFYVLAPTYRNVDSISQNYTNSIGIAFSDTLYYEHLILESTQKSLSINADIDYADEIIREWMGWKRISGCYRANGGESYIIIGSFREFHEVLQFYQGPDAVLFVDDVFIGSFNPLPDTVYICNEGDEFTFDGEFLDGIVSWSTGSIDPSITITKPGQYVLSVEMDNCVLKDTVEVIDLRYSSVSVLTDTIICKDSILQLEPHFPGQVEWDDGSVMQTKQVTESGVYYANVTNECGQYYFEYLVGVKECDCSIYVPSAFTPNGDGINDKLEVFVECDYPINYMDFRVYDRWGNLVFETNDINQRQWDGTLRGNQVDPAPLVWYLEYEVEINGKAEKKQKSGTVQILK